MGRVMSILLPSALGTALVTQAQCLEEGDVDIRSAWALCPWAMKKLRQWRSEMLPWYRHLMVWYIALSTRNKHPTFTAIHLGNPETPAWCPYKRWKSEHRHGEPWEGVEMMTFISHKYGWLLDVLWTYSLDGMAVPCLSLWEAVSSALTSRLMSTYISSLGLSTNHSGALFPHLRNGTANITVQSHSKNCRSLESSTHSTWKVKATG